MVTRMSLYHQQNTPHNRHFNFWRKYKWLIVSLLILFSLIGSYFGYQSYQNYLIDQYEVKGIMISQSDAYIDFVSLANSGQKFVYIRASQGATYTDDDFSDNFQRGQGSGLQVGSYHIFSTQSSVHDQIKNFTKKVGSDYGTLPPMVVVRDNLSKKQIQQLSDFIYRLHHYYDTDVMVRSDYDTFKQLNPSIMHNVQYFSPDEDNKKANFIEVKKYRNINIDGSDILVNQVAFNGNKTGWQRYLLKNQDR